MCNKQQGIALIHQGPQYQKYETHACDQGN